jgi:hypothetical protein
MIAGMGYAQTMGIPFFRNFPSTEYDAPNQNFDIISGDDGTIYVANFEGLLYYDNCSWRMIHTPGITRITAVFRDSKNIIWTGGYNYIGHLVTDHKGQLQLHSLKNSTIQGEVQWIWETEGTVHFLTSHHKIFRVVDDTIELAPDAKLPTSGFSTLSTKSHITQVQELENGLRALSTTGEGVIFIDKDDNKLFSINEDNGLCSNNVAHITYNKLQTRTSLPPIPKDLMRHFIRGLFDGDGSISKYKQADKYRYELQFLGNPQLMQKVALEIENTIGIDKQIFYTRSVRSIENLSKTVSRSKKHILLVYNYMYEDANYYFKYKREKFEKIIQSH